jgi:hypothetical protein
MPTPDRLAIATLDAEQACLQAIAPGPIGTYALVRITGLHRDDVNDACKALAASGRVRRTEARAWSLVGHKHVPRRKPRRWEPAMIRRVRESRLPRAQLAAMLGCSVWTIRDIQVGKTWRHVGAVANG